MGVKKIIIINGPNLNLLGTRETDIYGSITLDDINKGLVEVAKSYNVELGFFQSNNEGDIIDFIHAHKDAAGLIINPGAYTHTSVAIRDAIAGTKVATVEVHLSNIHSREEFRKHSYIAPVAIGQISGFGHYSYTLGLLALIEHLKKIK